MNTGIKFAAVLLLGGSLAACESGPGRCIGEGTIVEMSDEKVLVNLDRDGVAILGYDPVAYFTDNKALAGDPKFRSNFGGAAYYFTSAEHKATFDAAPAQYAPQFGGYCAYAASIDTISPIDPQFFEIVDGRLLLQHNQRAWDAWHKDAAGNLVKADKNWPGLIATNGAPSRVLLNVDENGLALAGYDPTSYFIDGKPLLGNPMLTRQFQGATYHFIDVDHKNAFEKDPAKYLPQFGGFCGYAASINRVSTVNPEIWQLIDGHLVLQHTPRAYALFNEDTAGNYVKAEKYWPGLAHRRCE